MQTKKELNQDTIILLSQVNSGCKMAIDSMEQVGKSVDDKRLKDIITKYNDEHIKLEETTHRILNDAGVSEQEPGLLAKTFASVSASVKLMMKDDVHQAAGILTDGCNMGIKTLCEYRNHYKAADEKSVNLCQQLCDVEDRMLAELKPLL